MGHISTIEHVKAELDDVDAEALQSIREIIERSKRKSVVAPKPFIDASQNRSHSATATSEPLKFIGENLTLDEHKSLSIKERTLRKQQLKEQNYRWLRKKFSALGAAWLVVVDGQIIASGKSLKNRPMQPQISEICRRTGKFPLVFINDDFMLIEESASSWHATKEPGDFYPTIPITVSSGSHVVSLIGDLDTGAAQSFVDYDYLIARNIILPEIEDDYETSRHLGEAYHCVAKFLHVELSSKSGVTYAFEAAINCVLDWHISPFIKINPNRHALIGRDIMLELKPKVLPDFEKRQTEIVTAMKTSRTRKKVGQKKKRAPRPQRRA
jgi:hypothetical protein